MRQERMRRKSKRQVERVPFLIGQNFPPTMLARQPGQRVSYTGRKL